MPCSLLRKRSNAEMQRGVDKERGRLRARRWAQCMSLFSSSRFPFLACALRMLPVSLSFGVLLNSSAHTLSPRAHWFSLGPNPSKWSMSRSVRVSRHTLMEHASASVSQGVYHISDLSTGLYEMANGLVYYMPGCSTIGAHNSVSSEVCLVWEVRGGLYKSMKTVKQVWLTEHKKVVSP